MSDDLIETTVVELLVEQFVPDTLQTEVERIELLTTNAPVELLSSDGCDVITTEVPVIELVTAGEQGPPGPPGPAGPAGAVIETRRAGSVISANTVVYERDGLIFPLSHNDTANVFAVLGLAVASGQPGAEIAVQRGASVSDAAWSWAFGRVYLGQGGALTQTPPATGYQVLIGFAATPTSINLSIQDPIEV